MNQELIKFIELCLMDGVVTDKEREVIFRKSKKLGVPEDECEIILEGMIQQHKNNSTKSEPTQEVSPTPPPKEETTSSTEQNRLLTKDDIEGYDDMSIEEQIKQMGIINKKNTEYLDKLKSQNTTDKSEEREEGEFDENGNRIGVWRLYTDDKNWEEGEYDENGNKTGVWKSYWKDEIRSETPYVNGKIHGDVISHGLSIEPYVYEKYKNDILIYRRFNHHDSTEISSIEEFDDNGKQTLWISYDESGRKNSEKEFENGVIKTETFWSEGRLFLKSLYDDEGIITKKEVYETDGKLGTEEFFEDGIITHSISNRVFLKKTLFNKKGDKVEDKTFDDDGSLKFKTVYKEGKEEKKTTYLNGKIYFENHYSEKGKLIKEIKYTRNILDTESYKRVNVRTEKIFDEKGQLLNEIKTNFEDDEY